MAPQPKPLGEGRAAQPGGRLARRKARTVSAILDAAERHFLERGYESTKVDHIAHDADVAVGSLYNHFGGKEALYGALIERALDLFESYMDEDRDTDLSALDQTLDLAGRLARFARERPGQMRLLCLMEPATAPHDELRDVSARVSKSMADRERRTAALIEVAIRRGQVRPIDPRDAAAFLWSAWKGMLTLGPRAERAAPGRDRELRALLEAGLRIVVGGLASDEAREHDETVRALLESTPARTASREPRDTKPLVLERAPVAGDLRADFPELALWIAEVAAGQAESPAPVRRRMAAAGDRVTGADAIGTRSESTPWAYRVFARRVGIDPDEAERAVEAAALQQRTPLAEATGALPEDAQLIAVAETGVPVLAFDADRIDGELWLRRAAPGERVGDRAVEPGRPVLADRTRAVAVPFGPHDPEARVNRATKRMTLVALQVKGVPDVGIEEALWTVVEIARAGS
jgi:AcrR family transcriptional regulator/DNA/RNA-binding domain of Phe-tRNA-synthetase-like protein